MDLKYVGTGMVFYDQHEYQCHLYTDENHGEIFIKVIVNECMVDFLILPLEFEFLSGELNTGYKFQLISCTRIKMKDLISSDKSIFTYRSKYMLKGVGGKDCKKLTFLKMVFQLSNVIEWGEMSGYAIGEKYALVNNYDREITLFESDTERVAYIVGSDMLPVHITELLKDRIILKQNGNIEVTFKNNRIIDEFEKVYLKTKRLIELATLNNISLNRLTGWSTDNYVAHGEEEQERAINIISYAFTENEPTYANNRESWKWITLPELIRNESFNNYFKKYELLEPIIELYTEIIKSSEMSIIRVFLNIVQALETYHSRFVTNETTEFKNRIKLVILKDIPEEHKQSYSTFLLANTKGFITLESRLADLLLANFSMIFDTGDVKLLDFPSVVARTRNYYIHYDERIKDKGRILNEEEIPIYNNSLLSMLEYYLLLEIGFSDIEKIKEKLNRRWGNISQSLALMKKSSNLKQGKINLSKSTETTKDSDN